MLPAGVVPRADALTDSRTHRPVNEGSHRSDRAGQRACAYCSACLRTALPARCAGRRVSAPHATVCPCAGNCVATGKPEKRWMEVIRVLPWYPCVVVSTRGRTSNAVTGQQPARSEQEEAVASAAETGNATHCRFDVTSAGRGSGGRHTRGQQEHHHHHHHAQCA